MKKQWKQFLRASARERLFESEFSYTAVPWLVGYLHKAMKAGCKNEVEDILATLKNKHGITLDHEGNLCFVRSNEK